MMRFLGINIVHEVEDHVYGVLEKFVGRDAKEKKKSKNIIISFDGTGGEPGWAIQKEHSDLYGEVTGLGNVCKLHLYAGGNIGNTHHTFEDQIPLYYSGVGTRGRFKSLKAALGLGAMHDIYTTAYKDLEMVYESGDKIYVFGFSRGAATARLFVSYLDKNPIKTVKPEVAFLGVFDTVCESFPIAGGVGVSEEPRTLDVDGEDSSLPEIVKKAVHFVSIDDTRGPFAPTLFNEDTRVTEVWCPGVHSDIGGGYYHDGLSDVTLHCMKIEAEKAGMKCREITEATCNNSHHTILEPDYDPNLNEATFSEFDKDMKIEPNSLEPDIHNTMSLMYVIFNFFAGFLHRSIRKLKDDKNFHKDCTKPILLLDTAVCRVKEWDVQIPPEYSAPEASYTANKYRPKALLGIPYKVVSSKDMTVDETTVYNDIREVVDEW